jgi:NAD-dependent dihydropyrimidine dehydrogenase PreA subunit
MSRPVCIECHFCVFGECHRYPPSVVVVGGVDLAIWPDVTSGVLWCGEFRRARHQFPGLFEYFCPRCGNNGFPSANSADECTACANLNGTERAERPKPVVPPEEKQ